MLVSHNLLKTYVKHDFSVEELSDRLTMQGLEVEEIVTYGESLNNVKIGIINSIERHPNADKLTICSVNIGNEDLIIVCGASNMNVGDKVCVALLGAKLPNGLNIKKTKIRGVESYGMLCSKSELNLENTSDGIWILSPDATIGSDINTILPEKDAILNIALTANRGDCLSLMGVAREIAGMTFQTANYPNINIKIASNTKKADISIIDKDLCFRYTSRIVKGVKVKESPEWLKNALVKLGSRPINNVVDITNFVLLELGHPLHAFDLNKLNGQKIIVRKAKDGEHIVGIDGVERKLTSNMLVIADEKMPVAIAGVMGGQYSCVTNETTDLLLESAYFLPESVRSTSKIIDLSTESSYRFERGTDINNIIRSLDRCASLIYDICGGEISELVDVYPNKITQTQVELRIPFVNKRLGTNLTNKEIIKYLEPLEFSIKEKSNDLLSVIVPSFKTDVTREIDIVEEIARLYGYNNIQETIPPLHFNSENIDTHSLLEDKIRNILTGFGLSEIINYSFANYKELEKINFPDANLVKTKNPLTAENDFLRNSLFPGFVNTLIYNVNHGNKKINTFEIGNIFYKDNNNIVEKRKLAIGLYGLSCEKDTYNTKEKYFDFFDLKGIIESLLKKLANVTATFKLNNLKFLHPNKSTSIYLDKLEIGYLGECHPQFFEIYKLNNPFIFCELDLEKLAHVHLIERRYNTISKFPEVLRDLAILVDENLASSVVIDEIKNVSKFLTKIKLIDVYLGKHIPEGKKSLAFSLSFQDSHKTLSDELVNKDFDSIINRLREKCNGEMREI